MVDAVQQDSGEPVVPRVLHGVAERAAATDPADCTDAEVCRILTRPKSRVDGERPH
ncbi:hypothetical protein [Streptomyces sp. NPDC051909]|uniref:hypothetical protein n=1 Tax=Streptomyces sp. NPDC051909 TaxID=3154944 RepID=UPI00344A6B01